MTIEQELTQTKADLEAARAEAATNATQRDTFASDIEQLRKTGTALVGERDKFKADAEHATAEVGKLAKELQEEKDTFAKRSNALVTEAIAKHTGQPAVKADDTNSVASKTEDPLKGLTGLDRAIAAHKLSKAAK